MNLNWYASIPYLAHANTGQPLEVAWFDGVDDVAACLSRSRSVESFVTHRLLDAVCWFQSELDQQSTGE